MSPPISPIRKAVARITSQSFATVPHFYLRGEADAAALSEARIQLLDQAQTDVDVRITLTDFILRAMTLALRDCPKVNCIWQDDNIIQLPTIDVGMVVGLPDGLIIPVISEAGNLDLMELAKARAELVDAARKGRLPAKASRGGATSLSNLGASRVDDFSAIICPPQSSMLAVGRMAPRPYVVDGELCVRPTMRMCLSIDHRVLDGVIAAEFLGRIIELLEKPSLLLE